MMLSLPLLSLLLATTGFAAPSHREQGPAHVPVSALQLPSNQTQIVPPNTDPDYVVMGVGNQNYTCTSSGNYTTAGAVAQLLDISHLYGTEEFSQVQVDAYNIWSSYSSNDPLSHRLAGRLEDEFGTCVYGQHYFIKGSTGALSPKFDFTSSGPNRGNLDAYVVAAKAGNLPAPDRQQDVDWLRLNGTSGKLATEILRLYTKGGQPPSSCTPGSPEITVKYCAQYWFFGSTLNPSATW